MGTFFKLSRFTSPLAILAVLVPISALGQSPERQPTPQAEQEQEILRQIDAELPQAMVHLQNIVNINSGTMNIEGVKKVGSYLQKQFEDIGFNTQWVDGKGFSRAGHLQASYGKKGKKVLLIGHLDTVFSRQDEFQRFRKIDENHIAGPGITDMKGGDIIMLMVAKTLKEQGVLENLSLRIIMTGDEEKSGRPLSQSKKALIEDAKWADIALGFEDGDGNVKTAVIARRGSIGWTLNVKARSAHSSQIFTPEVGDGAIFEVSRILQAFHQSLSQVENLTFNPGLLVAGTRTDVDSASSTGSAFGKSNVIAKTAVAKGDIRAISPQQLKQAKRTMQKLVAQHLPHTRATLEFSNGYPPMAPTEGNRELLKWYSQASQDLGFGPVKAVNPRKAGAADISFTAGYVDMALDGLGLMGKGGHTRNEVADIRTLEQNAKKAAILLQRIAASQ